MRASAKQDFEILLTLSRPAILIWYGLKTRSIPSKSSILEIAARLNVSVRTIRRATRELEDAGLIELTTSVEHHYKSQAV